MIMVREYGHTLTKPKVLEMFKNRPDITPILKKRVRYRKDWEKTYLIKAWKKTLNDLANAGFLSLYQQKYWSIPKELTKDV